MSNKYIFFFFLFLFGFFTCFSQPNLKIGLKAGSGLVKKHEVDFSGFDLSRTTYSYRQGKIGIILELDLDGKNSISTGINQMTKGAVQIIINGMGYHQSFLVKEIPLQYSHYFLLSKRLYAKASGGLFIDITQGQSWENTLEADSNNIPTLTLSVKHNHNLNFTMGVALAFGINFKKIGSLEVISRYNQGFIPMYNYEFVSTTPVSNVTSFNVYGTYRSIELAYYFPLIKLKKKEVEKIVP